ncbi:MAG: hypothetical protein NTX48_15300 [Planctomycetales bacterium]|jgi:hypothetical protein|nr:hypothetical protein [Planctomycetales bacterium]
MIPSRMIRLTACLIALQLAGCAMVESPRVAMRRMTRQFTPRPTDVGEDSDEDDGQWDFVGDEGRADYDRERDPDPWYGKYIISEKARSIERNMGVDY